MAGLLIPLSNCADGFGSEAGPLVVVLFVWPAPSLLSQQLLPGAFALLQEIICYHPK